MEDERMDYYYGMKDRSPISCANYTCTLPDSLPTLLKEKKTCEKTGWTFR